MSLDFNLKSIEPNKEKTDLSLLLFLIKETEKGKIKWRRLPGWKGDLHKYMSQIRIEGTKKYIEVEYFINTSSTYYCYIRFLYNVRKYQNNKVREIKGSSVMSLLNTINKYENETKAK